MKSMKTLMISAAVCGAMALPMSGVAQPTGDHEVSAAFLLVQNIVCGKTKASDQFPRDKKTCTPIGKYMKANGIN